MLVHNTAYCETILQNDRLILRPLLIGDATAISCIRSDEQVNKYIDRASQLSEVGAKDFILKIQKGYEIRQWFYWAIFWVRYKSWGVIRKVILLKKKLSKQ